MDKGLKTQHYQNSLDYLKHHQMLAEKYVSQFPIEQIIDNFKINHEFMIILESKFLKWASLKRNV